MWYLGDNFLQRRRSPGTAAGEYRDWARIDYQPSIADLVPLLVTGQLPPGSTALDVGCNKGGVSLFLAQHGLNVLGIDLNKAAIKQAKLMAANANLPGQADFKVADILLDPLSGPFDVVLLVRVLTCFPAVSDWQALLKRAGVLVGPQGYLYVHDFLLSPESGNYRARYADGARQGWRPGNFAVNDAAGALSFIAHHHSEEEVAAITASWNRIHFSVHQSLSLNGNPCRMFEFLGRKL
jgi:SAM-dependent methyltransferase